MLNTQSNSKINVNRADHACCGTLDEAFLELLESTVGRKPTLMNHSILSRERSI